MNAKNPKKSEPAKSTDRQTPSIGVLGLVLACTIAPVGMVISLVTLVSAKRRQQKAPAAVAGLVIGLLLTLIFIAAYLYLEALLNGSFGPCADVAPGSSGGALIPYECP